MSMHSFDPKVAARVGVAAAVIYQDILVSARSGNIWTRNSVEAWSCLFPYLSAKQVRTCLRKLVEVGLVAEAAMNGSEFDRTKSYAPTAMIGGAA